MIDPKEEAKFAVLKAQCRELGVPPPPDIFIGLQVHDKNGVLVFDDRQRGHSWTRNFYNLIFGTVGEPGGSGGSSFGAGYLSGKNSSGTVYTTASQSPFRSTSWATAAAGFNNNAVNATYGILVGTGNTAFSVEHHALGTLIAHGAGSGQLSYTAMGLPTQAYTSATKTWRSYIGRVFNNNSGGAITVKESGLMWYGGLFSDRANFLMERSVLDPTVPVANGAQLTVSYEISMDFSAID